ncbi:MAG: cupin domain-containing protein [Spirochaetales bacterium]|nr:cupin domain-containing protein [Spirochaetales bacterium]
MYSAQKWIDELGLKKHPEGGYFIETYRCDEYIQKEHLPARFSGKRCFSTSIYFLLPGDEFSAFHRINQDEIWHFYTGSPLRIHIINPEGSYSGIVLGSNYTPGEVFQAIVPAGCYFGASCEDSSSYSLVGCTVAPGFEFDDLDIPERKALISLFPQNEYIIRKLTRENKTDEKI